MKKLVKKQELSQKSGLVAVSQTPFTDSEIGRLIAKLKKYALLYDGDLYQIYGE